MLCVFEKIYATDEGGGLQVVREEGPIPPRCLKTDAEGRPTHILMCRPGDEVRKEADGSMSFDIVTTAVPINPEKFSIREPQNDDERCGARANLIPVEVARAAHRDPVLHSVLMRWTLGGYPDLQAALADAVVRLSEGKAGILAQFTRHVALCGRPSA